MAVAGQQLVGKVTLGVLLAQVQTTGLVIVNRFIVQPQLELAAVLVPVVHEVFAGVGGHQAQEVLLGTVADQVEIQAGLGLVRDVAKHIEIHRQLVIGAFQQWVVEQPHRLRNLANQALGHRSAVEMAENAQQGIVIARPQCRPARRRQVCIVVTAQGFVLVALVAIGQPQAQHTAHVVILPGHGQQRRGLAAITRIGDVQIVVGVLEQRPEVIADHVRSDLPTAHRPANEGTHEVLSVIEHELVTRFSRDGFECRERVGAAAGAVAWQGRDLPVGGVEQCLDPRHLRRAEGVSDVGFMHDHALHRPQAVVHLGAGVVVGATGGDQVNRLATGRTRTHPLEVMPRLAVLEIDMRQEQMLEQPARHQAFPGARLVEQVFPLLHLQRFPGARRQALLVNRRAGGQPALQSLVLLIGQAGDRQRHAFLGVSAGIGIELAGRCAHIFAVEPQHNVVGQLGIGRQRRVVPQLQHARHQRSLAALGVQHRIEALLLPRLLTECVIKQPRSWRGLAALAVIHRHFACPACGALGAPEVELAGGVVAGVAGHAFLGEDRLDIAGIGNRRSGTLCLRSTGYQGQDGADDQTK